MADMTKMDIKEKFLTFFTNLVVPKNAPPILKQTRIEIKALVANKTADCFQPEDEKPAILCIFDFMDKFPSAISSSNVLLMFKIYYPVIKEDAELAEMADQLVKKLAWIEGAREQKSNRKQPKK